MKGKADVENAADALKRLSQGLEAQGRKRPRRGGKGAHEQDALVPAGTDMQDAAAEEQKQNDSIVQQGPGDGKHGTETETGAAYEAETDVGGLHETDVEMHHGTETDADAGRDEGSGAGDESRDEEGKEAKGEEEEEGEEGEEDTTLKLVMEAVAGASGKVDQATWAVTAAASTVGELEKQVGHQGRAVV